MMVCFLFFCGLVLGSFLLANAFAVMDFVFSRYTGSRPFLEWLEHVDEGMYEIPLLRIAFDLCLLLYFLPAFAICGKAMEDK